MANLSNWEKKLTPYLNRKLQIIAEVPLSESDLDDILDLARNEIKKTSLSKATQRFEKFYPFTFLVMLAHYASYNDQQGYWTALGDRLGNNQLFNYQWHQRFVKICQEKGLFTFTKNDMKNYYVATVRFHGGIPTYSLGDYFGKLVIPAVNKRDYREIPPKELLPELLKDEHSVDRPVRDFLENSGEMGKTWFDESCTLARHARENFGEVLAKESTPHLPLYIYQFFEKFNDGGLESRYRWRRPFIQVTPYAEDSPVALVLPQQNIPLEFFNKRLFWSVTWQGQEKPIEVQCELNRRGQDSFIEEEFLPLTAQPESLSISILSKDGQGKIEEIFRRWALPFYPPIGKVPLIAFRDNQVCIPNLQTLPEKPLYLLFKKDVSINSDGKAYQTRSYPSITGLWKNWKLESWDLSEALAIQLIGDSGISWDPIPIARELAQPELVDGHLFSYQENFEQPLYTSEPPKISIPIRRGMPVVQALTGWRVHVYSIGEADPVINKSYKLEEYLDEIEIRDDRANLPLRILLSESSSNPAGTFDIRVFGPRGIQTKHLIRLWPKLLVKGISQDFPTPDASDKDIQFEIYLPNGTSIENQGNVEQVEIINVDGNYLVNAHKNVYQVRLNLVQEKSDLKKIRVPVSIPLQRLRWALAEGNSPENFQWGQDILHLSISRLEQYQNSALHFQLNGLGEIRPKVKFQLVNLDENERVIQEAPLVSTGFTRDWLRVSLLPFKDTIKAANALLQFELAFRESAGAEPIRFPLVELSPQIDIRSAHLTQIDALNWRLSWDEPKPLKNKRILIVSNWQPWQPAIECTIPDDARGEFLISEVSLPPSQYDLYFYVLNPWSKPLTAPPEGISPLTVTLCAPEERLNELQFTEKDHDKSFEFAIEKAGIYDSLADYPKRDEAISEAAKHLRHLQNVKVLSSSIMWIKEKDVDRSIKAFYLNNLFYPELLTTMLDKYQKDDPALKDYLRLTAEVGKIHLKSVNLLLEKCDDPVVISACFNTLLNRKDKTIIKWITTMVESERLSIDDGVYYLSQLGDQFDWIMDELANSEWFTYADKLICEYFKDTFEKIEDRTSESYKINIFRAAPFETSSERMFTYLDYLLSVQWNESDVYEVIFFRHLDGIFTDYYFNEILKKYPKKSLGYIRKYAEDFPQYENLRENFEKEFPQASGLLREGLILDTPFGVATIGKITNLDGIPQQTVSLDDENFILKMVQGEGLNEVKAELNFKSRQIRFENSETAWRCELCGSFTHPDRGKLDEHKREAHLPFESLAFSQITGAFYFRPKDIKILEDQD